TWLSLTGPGPPSCWSCRAACPGPRGGRRQWSPAPCGPSRTRPRSPPWAGPAADRVATQLVEGALPLVGRTEAAVSADIGRRLVAEGHEHVNFAIVGSGPNSASPHHDAGARVIGPGEPIVCDF